MMKDIFGIRGDLVKGGSAPSGPGTLVAFSGGVASLAPGY